MIILKHKQQTALRKLFTEVYINTFDKEFQTHIGLADRQFYKDSFKEKCIADGKYLLKKAYNFGKEINWDQVEIWCHRKDIKSKTGSHVGLLLEYGNLYSFVVANGFGVPYNEWLYEDKYEHGSLRFTYNKETKKGQFTIFRGRKPRKVLI